MLIVFEPQSRLAEQLQREMQTGMNIEVIYADALPRHESCFELNARCGMVLFFFG